MTKILVINGSYRENGITDQTLDVMVQVAQASGAEVDVVRLREYPIEFCLNCRQCTQQPGEAPGQCVQDDAMHELVLKIEEADAYILATPTNFSSVTAIFKRFMERLVVYAYWPWEMDAPKYRKAKLPKKRALLLSSCAAPGLFGRLLYCTHKQLKISAKTIGAESVGSIFTGLIAKDPHPVLAEGVRHKAADLVMKLLK